MYAIIMWLDSCTELLEKFLTMMWNVWLGRTFAIPRAASVCCHSAGKFLGTTVRRLETFALDLMACAVLTLSPLVYAAVSRVQWQSEQLIAGYNGL